MNTPDMPDTIASAIALAARGAITLDQINAFGAVMKSRRAGINASLAEIANRADAIVAETDLLIRSIAAQDAVAKAEAASDGSPEHRDTLAIAKALSDALTGATGIDDKRFTLLRLEAVLKSAGIPLVNREDGHYHDNLDAAFDDKAERTGRFRAFYARFLTATERHDFIVDPAERKAHSALQAAIWRTRHANAGEFEAAMADCQRRLTALCALAGIPEPTEADLSPATLTALAHPEPDEVDTLEDREDAIRHERAKVLEAFRRLVNAVVPALDAADYSDPDTRQTAADLRAAMVEASNTTSINAMTRWMAEAGRHYAALTGQDVPETDGGSDDGPLY